MITIVDGPKYVIKLLGTQRLKKTEYRLMKYVLRHDCSEGMLLHNTVTGKLVLLNHEEKKAFNNLPVTDQALLSELVSDYFLVPCDYHEQDTVDKLRFIMRKLFFNKGINSYTILTTTNCNARCFYCYQSDYKHINMDAETVDSIFSFMKKHKSKEPLHIQWFGGEPLVGIARIDQLCEMLNRDGLEFSSTMISNGLLFNEEIAERAVKDWHLRNVQITLDGTEEIYNKVKAYVSSEPSPFKKVIHNIKILLERNVFVGIRLNLDRHNENNLILLINEINDLFPDKRNLNVYTHVLYENRGSSPIPRTENEREYLYKKQQELNEIIIEKGMYQKPFLSLPSIKYSSCMADNPGSVVVYPDGTLFKCEQTVAGDEIGHISGEIIRTNNLDKFTEPAKLEKCRNCKLYPSCYLLAECEGLKDRTESSCKFDVELKTQALLHHYNSHLTHAHDSETSPCSASCV